MSRNREKDKSVKIKVHQSHIQGAMKYKFLLKIYDHLHGQVSYKSSYYQSAHFCASICGLKQQTGLVKMHNVLGLTNIKINPLHEITVT